MTRLVSRAESFEMLESAFSVINFTSFDFYTIKQSLIDYVKLNYSENYNNFIESDEFIAILEIFAYVGETYAYRLDINASENFLSTATRKQSILRLAKFLSYNVSRNIPSRGLVKLTSIKTTEAIYDIDNQNLSNKFIYWSDINNTKWKEQFILVMNLVLKQGFGSVYPDERMQVDDVLFELYGVNNTPLNNGVFNYSTTISGQSIPMELVPCDLNENGPIEKRPEFNSSFSLLYGNDGLGDKSDTTGFFMFTKQGELQVQSKYYDGITPNQFLNINTTDINDTDVWINNVDSVTREVLNITSSKIKSGEWVEVDISHAQNIIFNTNPIRNKYEIETLEDDKIKIIFGDGEFADIPNGSFDIWFRTSINDTIIIPKSSITNNTASFNYVGQSGNTETFTFTYSLINNIQNNSPSEDIEHIRKTAPTVYYTQDRMVNGKDYNNFMLQDTSILKLRSLNRTFIGDSKYISWHDPKESYDNVKLFGNDLAIYYKDNTVISDIKNQESASIIFYNNIQPLLYSNDFFVLMSSNGIQPNDIRKTFSTVETANIIQALEDIANNTGAIQLFYHLDEDEWVVLKEEDIIGIYSVNLPFTNPLYDPSRVLYDIISPWALNGTEYSIECEGLIRIENDNGTDWKLEYKSKRIIAHSNDTKFWNTNNGNNIKSFDTLLSNQDEILVLDANKNATRNNLISRNYSYTILGQELVDTISPTTGLYDIHQLSVVPADVNDDNVPDDMTLAEIMNPIFELGANEMKELPFIVLYQDISPIIDIEFYYEGVIITPIDNDKVDKIKDLSGSLHAIVIAEYVYFQKDVTDNEITWIPKNTTKAVINAFLEDDVNWKRNSGRYPLNFLWMHYTPRYNLVDPASTNIIDTYIITRGYYTNMTEWLTNKTNLIPVEPTSLSLRNDYANLLESKMISDTMILHSGIIKILFGDKADKSLQASFKVIKKQNSVLTNNQIKVKIVDIIKSYFDINYWNFGETFYVTELITKIHNLMSSDINSIVLVPNDSNSIFGDLFIIQSREDEIFQPNISINDIEIVSTYIPENIKQYRGIR